MLMMTSTMIKARAMTVDEIGLLKKLHFETDIPKMTYKNDISK
jgi:hypothetical protein